MGDFTVIGIVGELLREMLRTNLRATFDGNFSSPDSVTLLSPKDLEGTAVNRLSLFLYRIVENAHMKNQPMEQIGAGRFRHPPLSLNLHYLMTPYAGETDEIRGWDIHTVLGRAMQVFYDNAVLEGPALFDLLKLISREDYHGTIERLRIILIPLSLDDLTKIWNSLDTTLRLSVCYEVRVILIDSERKKETRRIVEKNAEYFQIKGR